MPTIDRRRVQGNKGQISCFLKAFGDPLRKSLRPQVADQGDVIPRLRERKVHEGEGIMLDNLAGRRSYPIISRQIIPSTRSFFSARLFA